MTARRPSLPVLAIVLLPIAATCHREREPETPLSAAEHERRAAAEEREAARHLAIEHPPRSKVPKARYRCVDQPLAGVPYSGGQPLEVYRPCWTNELDPSEIDRRDARLHREAAARHRALAGQLIAAERSACVGIGEDEISHSPFAHREDVLRVEPVRDRRGEIIGARVTFRRVPGLDRLTLLRAIRCHQARAGVVGYAENFQPYCPVSVAYAWATVEDAADGLLVTVTSTAPRSAATIWGRALALTDAASRPPREAP